MGIEELVVKHRLERSEIAAAHRRIALVLEGEDFLVAAHRQTSLVVSPDTSSLPQLAWHLSFTRSPRRRGPGTGHSPNGILWNIRLLKQPHSDLMPANLITLAHFSVSSAISFPNSAGDPGSVTPPRSARRAFILGSSRAALTSLLSLSTISAGVTFGAPTP